MVWGLVMVLREMGCDGVSVASYRNGMGWD